MLSISEVGFVRRGDALYHIVLLWVGSHALHSIPLSIFRQSVSKLLSRARLGAVEDDDVLALVRKTKTQKI